MTSISVPRWLLLIGVFLIPSGAMAQQATGTIGGAVVDASGAVMPGVTVTLSSPGIVGGNQVAVTDERGTYQFVRLVPARYNVRTELQGFRPALREGIAVNADVTVRVDFSIDVGGLEETITVRGGVPLLDTSATLNQTVISQEIVEAIPTGKNLWAFGALVPGVLSQKIDVGGSESFQAATQKVHGSGDSESRYLVDGMNIGNSSSGGIMGYPDTMIYEEINFQAGQSPAENQQGGVVMNMITRSGSNVVRGSFEASGSREGWMSSNLSGSQLAELSSSIPARLLALNPNLRPSNGIPYIYDVGGFVSGPLLPDRLWWVATARRQANDQYQLGTYNPDGTLAHDDNDIRNYSGKLTWQATKTQQVSAFYNRTHKFRYHRRSGNFPGALFIEDRATDIQDQPIDAAIFKWTAPVSSNLLFDAGASTVSGPFARLPQPGVSNGDIPRLDIVTQVGEVANPVYMRDDQITRMFKSSVSYAKNAHNLKAGYVLDWWSFATSGYSVSHFPSGLTARYRNGVPDSAVLSNTPFAAETVSYTSGAFIQDKWTPFQKLTLNVGLRFQQTRGHNKAACQPDTVFVTGRCYDRMDNVPNWANWAPRFGVIYDLFGDGRTALKMTANRYVFGAVTEFGTRVNPVRSSSATVPWSDANGDGVLQLSELNMAASTGFDLGNNNRYAQDLDSPYSNELSWEVEQQLFDDMVISAGYYRRGIHNNVAARNLAVPTSGYTPLHVTEVSSGRQVTVYNQDPLTRGRFDVVWSNDPAMNQEFQGFDITVNKRMSDRWMMMGGYSYGRNTGDTFSGSDLNNPNFQYRRGRVATDVPHAVKLSGAYEAPLGLRVSGNYQYYTGFPRPISVNVTSATVLLTQVTQSLQVEPVGDTRLPSNSVTSVRVARNIQLGRSRVTPTLDVFNLTNSNTPQNLVNQLGPTFGRVAATSAAGGGSGVLRPRMIRLGLSMTF